MFACKAIQLNYHNGNKPSLSLGPNGNGAVERERERERERELFVQKPLLLVHCSRRLFACENISLARSFSRPIESPIESIRFFDPPKRAKYAPFAHAQNASLSLSFPQTQTLDLPPFWKWLINHSLQLFAGTGNGPNKKR